MSSKLIFVESGLKITNWTGQLHLAVNVNSTDDKNILLNTCIDLSGYKIFGIRYEMKNVLATYE